MPIASKILVLAGASSLLLLGGQTLFAANSGSITYKTAAEILNAADANYTRTTTTYFNADSFSAVLGKNRFDCFTQSRKTLWTDHALYMHNESTQINSGYLDMNQKIYHYTLHNGLQDLAKTDKTLVENLREDYVSAETDFTIHDFFTGAHSFKKQAASLATFFSPTGEGVYASTEASLFTDFMFFCAPLYTNPEVEAGTPYLTFSKTEIVDLGDGSYQYRLYATETEKLSQTNGLFATATVSSIGTTSLPIMNAYLA